MMVIGVMSVRIRNRRVYIKQTNMSNVFYINVNKSDIKKLVGEDVSLDSDILSEFRFKNKSGKINALLRIYEYKTYYRLYVPTVIVETLEKVFQFDASAVNLFADLSFNDAFSKVRIVLKEES